MVLEDIGGIRLADEVENLKCIDRTNSSFRKPLLFDTIANVFFDPKKMVLVTIDTSKTTITKQDSGFLSLSWQIPSPVILRLELGTSAKVLDSYR